MGVVDTGTTFPHQIIPSVSSRLIADHHVQSLFLQEPASPQLTKLSHTLLIWLSGSLHAVNEPVTPSTMLDLIRTSALQPGWIKLVPQCVNYISAPSQAYFSSQVLEKTVRDMWNQKVCSYTKSCEVPQHRLLGCLALV
jgi:hypothetical protein